MESSVQKPPFDPATAGGGMWDSISGILEAELRVITDAPIIFVTALGIGAWVIWKIVEGHFKERIEAKDARIELLEAHLLSSQAELQALALKQGYQQAAPKAAEETIAHLEARLRAMEPRRLSQVQRQAIGAFIRRHPDLGRGKISVAHDAGCPDAKQLAAELGAALAQSSQTAFQYPMVMGPNFQPPSGVGVAVKQMDSSAARLVFGALDAAGIEYEARIEDRQEVDVEVLITTKIA